MAKGKEFSNKKADFAKGGNTPMFGAQKAGPEQPGNTAHATKGDGGKFASGGSTKMFGFRPAGPAKAGQTGQ